MPFLTEVLVVIGKVPVVIFFFLLDLDANCHPTDVDDQL